MVTRKNPGQLALMRKAGRVVAEMHEECIRAAVPGATTLQGARTIDFVVGDGTLHAIMSESAHEVQSLYAVLML